MKSNIVSGGKLDQEVAKKRDLKITAYVIVIPQAFFRDDWNQPRSGHFAEM